jgi:peptidyl-prolyl cis-trans isomerase C
MYCRKRMAGGAARNRRSRPASVVCGLLSVVLLLSTAPYAAAEDIARPLRDDDVVARVNGTPIYRKVVREVVQGALLEQEKQPDPDSIGQLAEDALDSLIDFELLYQESQARNVAVSDAAVDQEIARTKSKFPDTRSFEKVLKAKGMTEDALRRDTRKTMAVNRLLEGSVFKDAQVPDAQIKDFYERNKGEFKHPPQTRASHILVRVPENAPASEHDSAKTTAAALLAQLQAGADFAQMARDHSQDPASAAQGGDLGYFAKGDMVEAVEKTADALAPGQLSGVVSTAYGYDIIKVTDRRGAGYEPLPEVHERIRAVLLKTERQKRQAAFVAELRKKAKIQVTEKQ